MKIYPLLAVLWLLPWSAQAVNKLQWKQLSAQSEHVSSKAWRGVFSAANGVSRDASSFYRPRNLLLSAKATLAIRSKKRLTWLLPVAADAGFQAKLYQAEPSFRLGVGAVISTSQASSLSLQVTDLLAAGGRVKERACYDKYRRSFHCGTGLAWTDYTKSPLHHRSRIQNPSLRIRFLHSF
jgi:hypothetical protein